MYVIVVGLELVVLCCRVCVCAVGVVVGISGGGGGCPLLPVGVVGMGWFFSFYL